MRVALLTLLWMLAPLGLIMGGWLGLTAGLIAAGCGAALMHSLRTRTAPVTTPVLETS